VAKTTNLVAGEPEYIVEMSMAPVVSDLLRSRR